MWVCNNLTILIPVQATFGFFRYQHDLIVKGIIY